MSGSTSPIPPPKPPERQAEIRELLALTHRQQPNLNEPPADPERPAPDATLDPFKSSSDAQSRRPLADGNEFRIGTEPCLVT